VMRVEYHGRYTAVYRYWIDLERDSATLKYSSDLGGYSTTFVVSNQLTSGIWLPCGWTVIELRRGKEIRTDSVVVSAALHTTLPDEEFILKPVPGMFVEEYEHFREAETGDSSHRRTNYRLNANGERTEQSKRFYHYNKTTGRVREGIIP